MVRIAEEAPKTNIDEALGTAFRQQDAKLVREAPGSSRTDLAGEAAQVARDAPVAPDGQLGRISKEGFRAPNVVEMAVDTGHHRIGANVPEGRERRLHFLDALPRVDDNDALGTTHKGLVRQAVTYKAPSIGTNGVELLLKPRAVGQQTPVHRLSHRTAYPFLGKH